MLRPEIIEPDAAALAGFTVALETRNLSRAVAGKLLVNDISVEVRQGEVLAVVGPSRRANHLSCGSSTGSTSQLAAPFW